ncbi:asparagine synthase (glutamine-hydrolyzing) [Actinophytocola sp.]|uniref:asparagine synthase (glutamine-hydrolyzing) n=1 Tax=Actinophytocola sp. TaxID=1872138 RepID=UPI00389A35E4
MCRIHGQFNADVSPAELRRVAAAQRHGGPDGTGHARGPRWALGANRLAVTDPAGGRQPYELFGGAITVVFNGELYNHDELRRDLTARGYPFTDRCDGSILPALYHCYGDRFVEHLDGMYAIAVLDQRASPRLLLVTDHIGMKPLYYSRRGDALYFASELPALLAFGAVPAEPWLPGLDAYLATKTPFGEQTMFAGIRVLPPASTAVCDRTGFRVVRRPPNSTVDSDVRETLRREVRRLLVADVPVATITSGGLDSSLVTALAAEQGPVHTFNIAYRGTWPGDERHFAERVAAHTGAVYHQVEIDPRDFPDLLAGTVRHLGQPNADPITLSSYALFAAVRDAGFTVALTGDAADELFAGYGRMRAAAHAGENWLRSYVDALGVLPAGARRSLYTSDYAAEVAETPGLDQLRDGPGSPLRRIMAFEQAYRLPAYHLRRVDHLSMASSVEARLPFCQPGVVRAAAALPDESLIDGTGVKRALYRAARGLLPAAVLNRPKQPFTLPVTAMLAPGWPLWDLVTDLLEPHRLRSAGQVEPATVATLLARQAERPDDTTALTIWALAVHELWREQTLALRQNEEVAA